MSRRRPPAWAGEVWPKPGVSRRVTEATVEPKKPEITTAPPRRHREVIVFDARRDGKTAKAAAAARRIAKEVGWALRPPPKPSSLPSVVSSTIEVGSRILGKGADLIIVDDIWNEWNDWELLGLDMAKQPIDTGDAEFVAGVINDWIRANPERVFENTKVVQSSVRLVNNSFRTHSFQGGEEFILRPETYVGKRGKMNFSLEPADSRNFVRLEMPAELACEALAGFKGFLQGVLGMPLSEATTKLRATIAAERVEATKIVYEENPTWGTW